MNKREFLRAGAALAGSACLGNHALWAASADPQSSAAGPVELSAGLVEQRLAASGAATQLWGFNGQVPGPVLRYRKGQRLDLSLHNTLPISTTLHWHGVRVPHAMDGVPHVTQPPVPQGGRFRYHFDLPDSGTFWYHPHHSSLEQVGRGLYGALIVEEERPVEVDREVVCVLGDFLVNAATGIIAPFGQIGELAGDGRWGNVVTVNGKPLAWNEVVRAGDRLRLRLINAATARVFALTVAGAESWVIAYDGQAVTPHPARKPLRLGPGMRVDLIVDFNGQPGDRAYLRDSRAKAAVVEFAYAGEPPLRTGARGAPMALARNQFSPLNLKKAVSHHIQFTGGDSGPPAIGWIDGKEISYAEMKRRYGLAWTVNSHAAHEDAHEHVPLLTMKRGETQVLVLTNATGFGHPMHLHGHFFKVLKYNDEAPAHEEWRDTVWMNSWDEVEIAFVAGEPGDWMFHCHILEHAAAGMMGTFRVE